MFYYRETNERTDNNSNRKDTDWLEKFYKSLIVITIKWLINSQTYAMPGLNF